MIKFGQTFQRDLIDSIQGKDYPQEILYTADLENVFFLIGGDVEDFEDKKNFKHFYQVSI